MSRVVGPPPKCISARLIRLSHDLAENLTVCENISLLNYLKENTTPRAYLLGRYLEKYRTFEGTDLHQPARALQNLIIDVDLGFAAALRSQVQLTLDDCNGMVRCEMSQRSPTSARQNVKLDQLREDQRRLMRLSAELRPFHTPYRPTIEPAHRAQTRPIELRRIYPTHSMPRKRVYSDDDSNPNTTKERSPKKVRLTDPSNGMLVTVLDLCGDSDDEEPFTQRKQAEPRNEPRAALAKPPFVNDSIAMPAAFANAPRPQLRGRCKKGTSPDKKLSRTWDVGALPKGKFPARKQSRSAGPRNVRIQSANTPIDLASTILRSIGRHANLPPLNHGMEKVLSRNKVKMYTNPFSTGDKSLAQAQDEIAVQALNWWKARDN